MTPTKADLARAEKTAAKIADKIFPYSESMWVEKDVRFIEKEIAATLAEVRAEGARDAIIEFCEGDRSKLAQACEKAAQEGYERGVNLNVTPLVHAAFASGVEAMREMAAKVIDQAVWVDEGVVRYSKNPLGIADEIRALPIPEAERKLKKPSPSSPSHPIR